MTNQERMAEVLQQTIPETAEFFNDKFGCPPFNDQYDDGCRQCRNCRECWTHYLESEVSTNDHA